MPMDINEKKKPVPPRPQSNNWIVSMCGSESDTIWSTLVRGTKEQVMDFMLEKAAEDRKAYKDAYDFDWEDGPTNHNDITPSRDNTAIDCCCFYANTHTLISARICPPAKTLGRK